MANVTINEDYAGNGGKLVFNTVSTMMIPKRDRLQVPSGNTSGNTFVAVNNIEELGHKPLKVLKLLTLLAIPTVLKSEVVLLLEPMTTTWCRKGKTGI